MPKQKQITWIIYIWLPDPDMEDKEERRALGILTDRHYYLGLLVAPTRIKAIEQASQIYPYTKIQATTKYSGMGCARKERIIAWLQSGNSGFY